mmetsp:Transcript_9101/g.19439  ORF Transcript_9101/g.19439 Transcript_9101/m.19439 type:complete len:94 (+) Transcript_9101:247-528(+)
MDHLPHEFNNDSGVPTLTIEGCLNPMLNHISLMVSLVYCVRSRSGQITTILRQQIFYFTNIQNKCVKLFLLQLKSTCHQTMPNANEPPNAEEY